MTVASRDFRNVVHSCDQVQVTKVVVAEGLGTEEDPIRAVAYWYDPDGRLIARRDGWEETREGPR